MLDKHPLNYGVHAPALRFVVGTCQTMMAGGLAVTIYQKIGCNLGWNNFHFNTMSVALLAISSWYINLAFFQH